MTIVINKTLTLANLLAQFEEFKNDKSDNPMNIFVFNREECDLLSQVIQSYWSELKQKGMDKEWI